MRPFRTFATAHQWWDELRRNPNLRVIDLAARHGVAKSWVSRNLRLAFLDPVIVEQALSGNAPAHLQAEALYKPDAVPALWSAQHRLHRIG